MTDGAGDPPPGGGSRRLALGAAFVVLLLAALARLANLAEAFPDGRALFPPFDDLYHARRVSETLARFPHVLERDPLRGVEPLFCHWPPAWDLGLATVAVAAGARGAAEALDVAAFVPPLLGALTAAVAAALAVRRWGLLPGLVTGGLLGLTPVLVEAAQVSRIDHHAAEPLLVLALLASTARAAGAGGDARRDAPLLGGAVAGALLVHPALLLVAGLAAVVLLFAASRRAPFVGAAGFAAASAAVFAYRATRSEGYPESQWFLGTPHAGLLLGAAVALGAAALLRRRGLGRAASGMAGGVAGAAAAASVPGTLPAFLEGSKFFGGDPWIDRVAEQQPLLSSGSTALPAVVLLLGGGLLLIPVLFVRRRGVTPASGVLAIFTVTLTLLAFSRARFAVQAAALLAVAAGAAVARLGTARQAGRVAALVALGPTVWGAAGLVLSPAPIVPALAYPALRAAVALRERPEPGRVLTPENWGFVFLVGAGRGVLVDPFGSMSDPRAYERALGLYLETREERFVEACRRLGVRFVAFESPLAGLPEAARRLGLPGEAFLREPAGGGPPTVTRLAQATVWWRAYYDGGRARPERGPWGAPLSRLVKVYEDPARTPELAPYGGSVLQLWRVDPGPEPGIGRR